MATGIQPSTLRERDGARRLQFARSFRGAARSGTPEAALAPKTEDEVLAEALAQNAGSRFSLNEVILMCKTQDLTPRIVAEQVAREAQRPLLPMPFATSGNHRHAFAPFQKPR